jgi:hypothetical protein
MGKAKIRKIVTNVEEIYLEGCKEVENPIRRCTVAAVIENPCAGKYVEDLTELIEIGEELGGKLTEIGIEALKTPVVNYGKAAIVGLNGEIEHGGAILHPKLGRSMRATIGGNCKALIQCNKKVASAGAKIDIPVGYRTAAAVRSHYDSIPEVRIWDAPKPDEIVVIVALTDGGRPHPRIGGWRMEDVIGEDGLK